VLPSRVSLRGSTAFLLRIGWSAWAVLSAALLGCSAPTDGSLRLTRNIVTGNDNRVEPFDLPPNIRETTATTVAMLFAHRLAWDSGGGVSIRAKSAQEQLDLCSDDPFSDQPVAAFCSAVLIDENLVATAGHCLADDPELLCRQILVVLGYSYPGPNEAIQIRNEDVFACRRVVALEVESADYAIIELERPSALVPATFSSRRVVSGDKITVASYPAGLPMKCEVDAAVDAADEGASFFTAETDTFGGSSGGAIFNDAQQLVGLVAHGAPDWITVGDCMRAAHSDVSHESHQHADTVRDALCATGFPSERICRRPPVCGDGVCGSDESLTCPVDCAATCGDGVCGLAERTTCAADCARYTAVPPEWPLSPESYLLAHQPHDTPRQPRGCQISVGGSGEPNLVLLLASLLARFRRGSRRHASKRPV